MKGNFNFHASMTKENIAIICDNIQALTAKQQDLLLLLLNPLKSLRQISEEFPKPQIHQSVEAKEQHYLYIRKLASELYRDVFENVELEKSTSPRQYLFSSNTALLDCLKKVLKLPDTL